MAFADCLGAVGAFLPLPEGATGTTTIESKTNFLGAGPVGSVLVGEAVPVKIGKRLSVWQTRIRTEAGTEVALVTQTQMVLWPAWATRRPSARCARMANMARSSTPWRVNRRYKKRLVGKRCGRAFSFLCTR